MDKSVDKLAVKMLKLVAEDAQEKCHTNDDFDGGMNKIMANISIVWSTTAIGQIVSSRRNRKEGARMLADYLARLTGMIADMYGEDQMSKYKNWKKQHECTSDDCTNCNEEHKHEDDDKPPEIRPRFNMN